MKRSIDELEDGSFDLLVVGGGSHGACIARDAALRGLSVALIEQGDFSSGTSHNSLKIVHSGIRYLQHLDIRRIRESINELRTWLTIAPHLVQPLQMVIPTQGYLSRGPMALQIALLLHRLLGLGLPASVPATAKIPLGRVRMKSSLADTIPGLPLDGLSGSASWHDGQFLDADRVVLECVEAAARIGAVVANYVSATSLLYSDRKVSGVTAVDEIKRTEFEIRARMTILAGGPWTEQILAGSLPDNAQVSVPPLARNMNIVTRRMFSEFGIGIPSKRSSDGVIGSESRLFFVTPWKNVSVIGTTHFPYEHGPDDYHVSDSEIDEFINEINESYPSANLKSSDVLYVYGGLTPAESEANRGEVGRSKQAEIVDHSSSSGIEGLVSVIGVKYTTARLVGERAVTLAMRKLGAHGDATIGRKALLPGAQNWTARRRASAPDTADARIEDLLAPYGSAPPDAVSDGVGEFTEVFAECVRHAVREEMAMTLQDVLLRRTDLLERGLLTEELLQIAARVMGEERDWVQSRVDGACAKIRANTRYLASPTGAAT